MSEFNDAQALSRQYPDTFEAPTPEELDALEQGDYVKVCLDKERFWTRVVKIEGVKVRAKVANDILTIPYKLNDDISFFLHNIYSIMKKGEI